MAKTQATRDLEIKEDAKRRRASGSTDTTRDKILDAAEACDRERLPSLRLSRRW